MNSPQQNVPLGMQRDLRAWWWTIAVIGLAAFAALFAYRTTVQMRLIMLVWLALFVVIGLYQRRKTHWPDRPPESATPDDVRAYRSALERRRDEQRRWPARQLPVLVVAVTIAFSASLVQLFAVQAVISH